MYMYQKGQLEGKTKTPFQEIENIVSTAPQREKYALMGDFSACVGSRECVGNLWDGVRGPHGYGEVNNAGKGPLSLFPVHLATVCNT